MLSLKSYTSYLKAQNNFFLTLKIKRFMKWVLKTQWKRFVPCKYLTAIHNEYNFKNSFMKIPY